MLRLFNTYGPRQSARAVIPTIVTQIAAARDGGEPCRLRLGATAPTRDFNYIADTVGGFVAAAATKAGVGEVIIIGSNFEISVGETAALIAGIMQTEIVIETDDVHLRPAASEIARLWGDNSRAADLLGWRPAYAGRDGFRRGLLRELATSEPVAEIMNRAPRTFRFGEPQGDVLAFIRRERVQHVPIVDFAGRVVDLVTVESLLQPKPQDMPVVLMAGGKGLRLRPLSDTVPNPMLEVGGKPILENIVRRLAAAGFASFHISMNYRAEVIQQHFGDGSAFGVSVRYIAENEPLGTGGPLGLLQRDLDKPVLVINGDVLTKVEPARMVAFHGQNRSGATMGVRGHEMQVPNGVVDMENYRIVGLREKPVERYYINAGIYVLGPEARALIPAGNASDMPALFEACQAVGVRTLAFPIWDYWVDAGQPNDYRRAKEEFASIV